jgi:hypothetical protein
VRKVIEPIAGQVTPNDTTYTDDVSYVRDLGLVREGNPVTIANPIYREVTVRLLASGVEQQITASPQRFLLPDGRLDIRLVLQEFTAFWRENGEIVTKGMTYHETAPQLVLMAYLQRIVNGGGYIDGLGLANGTLVIFDRRYEAPSIPTASNSAPRKPPADSRSPCYADRSTPWPTRTTDGWTGGTASTVPSAKAA